MIKFLRKLTRSFLFVINIIFIILLILSTLCAYVSPKYYGIVSIMEFIFPVLWIINVVFVIFWSFKKRKRLMLSLLVVIFSWPQWNNTFQFFGNNIESTKELNNPISVMSYNVRMFDLFHWINKEKKYTVDSIISVIKKEDPDIICLQEFFVSKKNKRLLKHKILSYFDRYKYKYLQFVKSPDTNFLTGLVTFSKYKIVNSKTIYYNNTSNFTIQTDIDVNGHKIRVFNNHLGSIHLIKEDYNFINGIKNKNKHNRGWYEVEKIKDKLTNAFYKRTEQAEILKKHIDNSPYGVVVCGDFNDTPTSYVYNLLADDSLKDAFIESGSCFSGTYNGTLPSFRIDYIFFSSEFNGYNYKRQKVNYSDHYPISTIIDLQ